MLLRNYYSSLTYSTIGNTNVTEDVSAELSPRYSRRLNGEYGLSGFPSYLIDLNWPCNFYYGTQYTTSPRVIWFGNNTTQPSFNDYGPVSSVGNYDISSTRTQYSTTYDDNTKIYTSKETYTLTNNNSNALEINEILYGGSGRRVNDGSFFEAIAVIREVLGDNSFTLQAGESVKFELTIKYTIAEPLR